MPKYPKINYIGNKEKLSEWIIKEIPVHKGIVLDLFAGGCSVSYALKQSGFKVISNDVLYSNYVIAKAIITNNSVLFDKKKLFKIIDKEKIAECRNILSFLEESLYFDYEVDELANLVCISKTLKGLEKYLFLSLLRRAMIRKLPYSRMNVPWNQIMKLRNEEYSYLKYGRKRAYHNKTFTEHILDNIDDYNKAVFDNGENCLAYNYDALTMVKKIDFVDVVYIDPPYPSTMNNYDAFYGSFDCIFDKAKKHTDFTNRNSFLFNLEKIIKSLILKTNFIMISINSKVEPKPDAIVNMLSKYGEIEIKEMPHSYKVTGKNNKNNNMELLIILSLK